MNPSEIATLRAEARRFLESECPISVVRSGEWSNLWKKMCELGWLGVAIDEEHAGLGLGASGLCALAHESGRAVAPTPFLFTAAIVAPVLASSNDALLSTVLSGERVFGVAAQGWVVHPSDEVVSIDENRAALARVTVRPDSQWIDGGRAVSSATSLDPTMQIDVPETARIVARARTAIAAESLGAAERTLEIATGYAKQRIQFGKPIGSFQAVQHLLAQMLERVELCRAAIDGAARSIDAGEPDFNAKALVAKALASEACVRVAADSIQVHGGIGFTWEHDAHLYYRRTVGNAALLGTADWCRSQLAEMLL